MGRDVVNFAMEFFKFLNFSNLASGANDAGLNLARGRG